MTATIDEFINSLGDYVEYDSIELQREGNCLTITYNGTPTGLRKQIKGLAENKGLTVDTKKNDALRVFSS